MVPSKNRLLLSVSAAVCLAVSIAAALPLSQAPQTDIYRVDVASVTEAEILKLTGVDPLLRVTGGYLVLVSSAQQKRLAVSGLNYHLIAAGVDRQHLATDADHGQTSVGKYPVAFEEGGMRLYRVEPENFVAGRWPMGLAPIRTESLPILFTAPPRFDKSSSVSSDDLDSLLNRINQDSIIAYATHLESYNGRKVETYGNWASRTWLVDKFRTFGYDSVITDTFTAMGRDGNLITGHNVIAVKQGTDNPYHHIIIGAHYDTPDNINGPGISPGADDNGSGTVAVLEMARAFSGIETSQTLVFILFDAEEEYLLGSAAYADRTFAGNDRVALMINLDMVGYYENEHEAYLFMGNDSAFALLWNTLADSIPGIALSGHIETMAAWDDQPFSNYGWHTLAVHEYVFSTVYHSFHDSTTYLNFDYLTRMTRATAATAFVVDRQFIPDYELWMAASPGFSEITRPNAPTPIDIFIREYGGAQLVPGSALIHYSINDSTFTTTPLISMGYDIYRGYLPPVPCLDRIDYYVTADEDSLGTFYLPDQGSPVTSVSATGTVDVFYDDFGTDKGWSVSGDAWDGEWMRGSTLFNSSYFGTPEHDYDGNDICYQTDTNGYANVRKGTTTLISPAIDASAGETMFEYARWYSNHTGAAPYEDLFHVSVSNNNGASWHPVETVGPVEQASGRWYLRKFRLGDFVSPSAAVRLRFDASDEGEDSWVEAAVDAVRFYTFATDTRIVTETVPGWTAGHPMTCQLEAAVCEGNVTWVDRLDGLEGTGLTLSTAGLLSGIPTRVGPVAFRAYITDQWGGNDEELLSFVIHGALAITTTSIPHAVIDSSYSYQFRSTGGTGEKHWVDRDGNLAGTGLTLSADGVLSGTPTTTGTFPFVARIIDEAGASAEKAYDLRITVPYVCGDANDDETVNVGDAVYLINFVFKSGSPPVPMCAGDANGDGGVNVGDAVYLISYIFRGGSPPSQTCCP